MGSKARAWIEAMRPRTLPVSVAGVLAGLSCTLTYGSFRVLPFIICLLFAVMAQIVSNFANEYYDYKSGIDRKGREGFRRGVTEGDISPRAMKRATFMLLGCACLLGCSLIIWGGWWMLLVGAFIALFALAYSAGPWPLSRVGLGDVAVVVFYGVVPVVFTCYLTGGSMQNLGLTVAVGVAIGFLADNVLIVNNYRDVADDREVGKRTTAVIFGRRFMLGVYIFNFSLALIIIAWFFLLFRNILWIILWVIIEIFYIFVVSKIGSREGSALNPMLKVTAQLMLLVCAGMVVAAAT